MTASPADRVRTLRTAASILRKLDEIDSIADFKFEIDTLEDLADEIQQDGIAGLGEARIREIMEHIDAAGLTS